MLLSFFLNYRKSENTQFFLSDKKGSMGDSRKGAEGFSRGGAEGEGRGVSIRMLMLRVLRNNLIDQIAVI